MGWIAASLFATSVAASAPLGAPTRYDGHRILRVQPRDAQQRRYVTELAEEVWTERPGPKFVDIRVTPQQAAELAMTGIPYTVVHADLQARVEVERDRLAAAAGVQQFGTWFDDFKDLAEVEAYVDELAALAPELVTVESVGSSLQGQPIRALRIGVPAQGKTAMLLTGTMHAREWLSTMVTMCMADQLVRDHGQDEEITQLLREIDIFVIPVVNPDGYAYSWQAQRYWRKNRREEFGVDLNRNWGHEWGGDGSSSNPGDENYRGSAPFSEPETQAVADFMSAHAELVSHIDFHAYAELILYPWGYGYEPAPDAATLSMLADDMASAIGSVHGRGYQPVQGANFYPAAGVVDDWAYGELGMMSFAIELRGDDFVVAPSQIVPACEENFAAVLDLGLWSTQFSEVDPTSAGTTTGAESGTASGGTNPDDPTATSAGGTGSGDQPPPSDSEDDGSSSSTTSAGAPPDGHSRDPDAGCACHSSSPQDAAGWLALWGLLGLRRRH